MEEVGSLSERKAVGTVREDYSSDGNAWNYFSHDQSSLRAYRWGEDGLAGISDDKQQLCFAVALRNSRDPILNERLFGLTNSDGNHGEEVKEYYFYLDSTPMHSYMKYLYKYPQREFPYRDLVETNGRRSREVRRSGGQPPNGLDGAHRTHARFICAVWARKIRYEKPRQLWRR
jgi:hypothetical protein